MVFNARKSYSFLQESKKALCNSSEPVVAASKSPVASYCWPSAASTSLVLPSPAGGSKQQQPKKGGSKQDQPQKEVATQSTKEEPNKSKHKDPADPTGLLKMFSARKA